MKRWQRAVSVVTGATALVGMAAPAAQACAVCFGDPNDPLVKGAASGVVFMAVVIYGVLLSMVGMASLCLIRARRIRARSIGIDTPSPSTPNVS